MLSCSEVVGVPYHAALSTATRWIGLGELGVHTKVGKPLMLSVHWAGKLTQNWPGGKNPKCFNPSGDCGTVKSLTNAVMSSDIQRPAAHELLII